MDFPNDVDYVIVGTGLAESMIAASLAITGHSVLHMDKHEHYGTFMTSFRFPELLNEINKWSAPPAIDSVPISTLDELNLATLSKSLFRNCASRFLVPETEGHTEAKGNQDEVTPNIYSCIEVLSASEDAPSSMSKANSQPNLHISNSSGPLPSSEPQPISDTTAAVAISDTTNALSSLSMDTSSLSSSNPSQPVAWTKATLIDRLRRADFDILPRLIFAESPIVKAMIRSDVTRYLEFRSINRLLSFNPEGRDQQETVDPKSRQPSIGPPQTTSSVLVKVPVSRGEVFQTRILSLSQKRMLVGFLEWCAAVTASSSSPDTSSEARARGLDSSSLDPEDAAYLDSPLIDYLQRKRNLDGFISRVVVNCLALANSTITLRNALPRFRRLICSMNRVGPFPLLWPMFGCGELPQSFCRMCAVFSGTYCLGRTITAIRTIDAGVDAHARRYIVHLSTGEQVSTSCVLIGADQAPSAWVLPQVRRWIARAILVTEASLFPAGHEPYDITLVPIPMQGQSEVAIEPAFLLETPVEKRNGRVELFITHLTASCDSCVDAAEFFASTIDILYAKDATGSNPSGKPRILWNCFFTLPDLSGVNQALLTANLGTEPAAIFVVPGPDSSLFMDGMVEQAESIFHQAFELVRRDSLRDASEPVSSQGETTTTALSTALISLDAHWDGIFPPRPPRPEDLVFVDPETGGESDDWGISTTPASARPAALPSGHGDWSVAAVDSTLGESEFTTAADP
uniref:Arf-GAP domain-containing protein n=2 Tax=Mesocestoides corti TaxID=53468 RepID=A0A5K3ENM0_MESCO